MERYIKIGEGFPVVIDVLRAASTIITAIANGIEKVIPLNSEEDISKYRRTDYLSAGEKDGVKLGTFDIGNSPTELLEKLKSSRNHYKGLVLKTTNATSRLCSLSEAYIVSSLNLDYAKNSLRNSNISIHIVGGKYGLAEDMIVGLALYGSIYGDVHIDDRCIKDNILNSDARRHLKEIGYEKDVNFIMNNLNLYNVLPKLENGVII